MLAVFVSLSLSASAVPAGVLSPEEPTGDGEPKLTRRIAAATTACAYRNSNAAGLVTGMSGWCAAPKKAGWGLSETYSVVHESGDTDNADLYRMGQHCLLSFHGADADVFTAADNKLVEFYGVKKEVGLWGGFTRELETILTVIRENYGTLAAWAATCTGKLFVTGHSMGGALASMFAYLANLKKDPLGIQRHSYRHMSCTCCL